MEGDAVGDRFAVPLVTGLDVGGTKTLAVVVDRYQRVVASIRRLAEHRGPEGLLATVTGALTDVADAAGVAVDAVAAVGIGVPGLVNRSNGTLSHAVNLGIADGPFDLAGPVGALVSAPVTVANDTNLAALGAAAILGEVDDLAFLALGTGVSVGLVLGGEVYPGSHSTAGEIGHLPIDSRGEVCECGQRGCLETVISGRAIARLWPADRSDGVGPAAALLAAAAAGDAKAIAVRDEVCGSIGAAVALVAQSIDPELVVLGGGVAEAGPPLLEAVQAALRERAAGSPLLAAFDLADRVAIVPAGVPVGALGAARAAWGTLL
ncbi:MAG: ROK family protein [Acidimicrobiales bacterium]